MTRAVATGERLTSVEIPNETRFFDNAIKYINLSKIAQEKGKYLESWKLSVPAKLNFLVDAIINACMIPITLVKSFCGLVKAGYTWGNETLYFRKSIKVLHEHANRTIASGFGVMFTNRGVLLRTNNNVLDFVSGAFIISFIALSFILIKRSGLFTKCDPCNNPSWQL
ncbi:MAG: hypothetical protein KR126chlam6_00330 [Candidatus Anoxychlamydiales bacterium]|nr:hypothetical protein [Candidatus Anoxychlamydiales bacterium]